MKTSRPALICLAALLAFWGAAPLRAADAHEGRSPFRPGAPSVVPSRTNSAERSIGVKQVPIRTPRFGEAPGRVYESAEEIKAMPRCKATVVDRVPCSVYLRTTGTNGFYIGSPGSKADVACFVNILKDGETYVFPEVFLQYQRKRQRARE